MLIYGFRSYVRTLAMVTALCSRCQNPAAQNIQSRVRKFTLFFIPLFPVSTKYFATCTFCGQTSSLTKDVATSMVAHGSGQAAPVAPAAPATAHPSGLPFAPAEPTGEAPAAAPQMPTRRPSPSPRP